MSWVAIDKYGKERLFSIKPDMINDECWIAEYVALEEGTGDQIYLNKAYVDAEVTEHTKLDITKCHVGIDLPKGSIKKLIGRELAFEDGAVELKEEEQQQTEVIFQFLTEYLPEEALERFRKKFPDTHCLLRWWIDVTALEKLKFSPRQGEIISVETISQLSTASNMKSNDEIFQFLQNISEQFKVGYVLYHKTTDTAKIVYNLELDL